MRCIQHIGLVAVTVIGCWSATLGAQGIRVSELDIPAIDSLLPAQTRTTLGIRFPVSKAYRFADSLGTHLLLLAEKPTPDTTDDSLAAESIQAMDVLFRNGHAQVHWKLIDFILPDNHAEEEAIWFWTRYLSIEDRDGDGVAEPVIVYGTSGMNGLGDGRLKLLTYVHGVKTAIRHQNGVLDHERHTQVDGAFYALPKPIRQGVMAIMDTIEAEERAIFPSGWREAMAEQQLTFDENE